jgi:endo-1,4-beta-xylanase
MKKKSFLAYGLLAIAILTIYSKSSSSDVSQLTDKFRRADKFFGSAVLWHALSSDTAYNRIARSFAVATPETEMKFSRLQKTRGQFNYGDADSIVAFCHKYQILIRGHTLVWADQGLPDWMLASDFPRDTLSVILKEHVLTVVRHFKGKLYCWDVVNEAIDNNGKMVPNIYYKKIGESYIDSAFIWAHAADPEVKLFYNDYFTNYGHNEYKSKLNLAYNLIYRLKNNNIKVDGIGIQMHMALDRPIDYDYLQEFLNKFAKLDMEIHFTELDVAVDTPFSDLKFHKQAEIYADITRLFLAVPACKAMVLWGFTDASSWIPHYTNFKKGAACILDSHYKSKPAFDSLIGVLKKRGKNN